MVDGDIKLFGVFDGHGVYGHLVSGFCAGKMLKYLRQYKIRTKEGKLEHVLISHDDEEITKAMK